MCLNGDLFYMSMSMNPLEKTPQDLHRFWFKISTKEQWYALIHECRNTYGKNWRSKRHVLRNFKSVKNLGQALQQWMRYNSYHEVWFEVPDPKFATWVAVKFSIEVSDIKHSQRVSPK